MSTIRTSHSQLLPLPFNCNRILILILLLLLSILSSVLLVHSLSPVDDPTASSINNQNSVRPPLPSLAALYSAPPTAQKAIPDEWACCRICSEAELMTTNMLQTNAASRAQHSLSRSHSHSHSHADSAPHFPPTLTRLIESSFQPKRRTRFGPSLSPRERMSIALDGFTTPDLMSCCPICSAEATGVPMETEEPNDPADKLAEKSQPSKVDLAGEYESEFDKFNRIGKPQGAVAPLPDRPPLSAVAKQAIVKLQAEHVNNGGDPDDENSPAKKAGSIEANPRGPQATLAPCCDICAVNARARAAQRRPRFAECCYAC